MKLYDFQEEVLRKTKDKNRVAYYLEMGLGKTFIGSEKMMELDAKANLIICQKSKIKDWLEHFDIYYDFVCVYDLTKPKEFIEFINKRSDIYTLGIINYELAWRRQDLLKLKNFTLMLDESSLIQNHKAKQTKFIMKLAIYAENVILLSGTPTSGKYENLWTQSRLLGWNISRTLYDQTYVNWELMDIGGVKFKIVDKRKPYKNVERLKRKLRENGAIFLKTEECYSLPAQNFINIKVSKSKIYDKFIKDGIVTVNNTELVGDTNLTKRIYARQLCGSYSKEKLEAFKSLLESTNDRLIVFYNFNDELRSLRQICEKLSKPVSVISGSEKDLTAYENENDSITLIQYQAGAMGLNLQKANKIVYFTPPERCELYMQSQKRIHRLGQTKACFYYRLVVTGSVEVAIYRALERGIDFTDKLFKEVIEWPKKKTLKTR